MAGIQIDGGGLQALPTIQKNWIGWNDATPEMWSVGSDTDPSRLIQGASNAGYGWSSNLGGDFSNSPFFTNTDNYEWAFDPTTGAPSVRVKSGDKTGTTVKYTQDASGNWVPNYDSQTNNYWDTNNNDDFYKGVGMVLGAAVGGNVLAASGGLGAAAQGAWQGGLSATEAAALGVGAGAAAPGEAAGAFTGSFGGSDLSSTLQYANYASKGLNTAGQLTGNETLSKIGGYGGALTGFGTGIENLWSGVSGGNWFDALKGAYSAYGSGNKIYNALTQEDPTGRVRNPMIAPTQGTGTGPQMSSERNWLDQILGVGAGVNSDIQNREAFRNLNDLFSRREQMRAPFEQKLLESYQNPNAYLDSPEYKALASIRGNELNRGAAKAGRLANDVDREVLMQTHAQKALGDYRGGLQNSISQMGLPYDIFRLAQDRNASRGAPTAGGIGYSGATAGIIDQLTKAGITGPTLTQIIQKLGLGGGGFTPNVGGEGDYGSNIPVGDPGFESDFPMDGGGWTPTDPTEWGPPEISYGGDVPFESDFPMNNMEWDFGDWSWDW